MPTYRKLPSGNIQAVVRVQGYGQRSKTFPSKRHARQWADQLEQQLRVGAMSSSGLMVVDIIQAYMDREPDYK